LNFYKNILEQTVISQVFSQNCNDSLPLPKNARLRKKIAIFASGSGTNAEEILKHFQENVTAEVGCIFTNKADAKINGVARNHKTPIFHFENSAFETGEIVVQKLLELNIDFIVLAGFLRKIPSNIIHSFEDRIINIHPALLPKHGGAGMYGMRVHQAVCDSQDVETGITIHLVNDAYDQGRILAQFACSIKKNATVQQIMISVQELEHTHYKHIIEKHIRDDQ